MTKCFGFDHFHIFFRIDPYFQLEGSEPILLDHLLSFINHFPDKVDEYESLLTRNPIWLDRTQGVGIITPEEAMAYGVSGPIARAAGIKLDLRKVAPYSGIEQYERMISSLTFEK